MKIKEGNNDSLGITLRRIGSKQSLAFTIFLSVVCLLVYLFALYLFSVRGIINQFGVETHREKLADCVALLSIEVCIPEDGLKKKVSDPVIRSPLIDAMLPRTGRFFPNQVSEFQKSRILSFWFSFVLKPCSSSSELKTHQTFPGLA